MRQGCIKRAMGDTLYAAHLETREVLMIDRAHEAKIASYCELLQWDSKVTITVDHEPEGNCIYWDASTVCWAQRSHWKDTVNGYTFGSSTLPLAYWFVFDVIETPRLTEYDIRHMRRSKASAVRAQELLIHYLDTKTTCLDLKCKILSMIHMSDPSVLFSVCSAAPRFVFEANKDKHITFKPFAPPLKAVGRFTLLKTLEQLNADEHTYNVRLNITVPVRYPSILPDQTCNGIVQQFMEGCHRGAGITHIWSNYCTTDLTIDNFPDLQTIDLALETATNNIHVKSCPKLQAVDVLSGEKFSFRPDVKLNQLSITDCPTLISLNVDSTQRIDVVGCSLLKLLTVRSNRLNHVHLENMCEGFKLDWAQERWTNYNWSEEQLAIRESLGSVLLIC